jgi:hypothetical protein
MSPVEWVQKGLGSDISMLSLDYSEAAPASKSEEYRAQNQKSEDQVAPHDCLQWALVDEAVINSAHFVGAGLGGSSSTGSEAKPFTYRHPDGVRT